MNFNTYTNAAPISDEDALCLLNNGNTDELKRLLISVSLHSQDQVYAERLCAMCSTHADEEVRGNAIIGLGHIIRRFGFLTESSKQIIKLSLMDESAYVRSHSYSAQEDVELFG